MHELLFVYGTRPEAIKMAPLVQAVRGRAELRPTVLVTGQHRAMLDQVNAVFGIEPEADLNIFSHGQTLEDVTAKTLVGLGPRLVTARPAAVVVQGDTTTCFAAALAAFYHQIPVIHLEAGLRTEHRYDPFPEEINRRLVTTLTSLHLAPTPTARANLLTAGVAPGDIVVTGNTVIDALLSVVHGRVPTSRQRTVLITSHRRESWGEPMRRAASAIARLAAAFGDVRFLFPIHLNPVVRAAFGPTLEAHRNVELVEPMDYRAFAFAMHDATLVLTDSGGVQEEAPSLGKPVLVMRDTTERPEAVTAGTVRLVGTDEDRIVAEVSALLTDAAAYAEMARATNPYGDGRAAQRSVQAIEHFFGLAERPDDFVAAEAALRR